MTTENRSFEAAWKAFCARLDQISADNKGLSRINAKLVRERDALRFKLREQVLRITQIQAQCAQLRSHAHVASVLCDPTERAIFQEFVQVLDAILKGDPPPAAL